MLLNTDEFDRFVEYIKEESQSQLSPMLLEFRLKIAVGGGIDLTVFNTETNVEVDLNYGKIDKRNYTSEEDL